MSLHNTKIPVDSCKSSDKTNSVQSKQRSSFSDVNVEQSHGHLKRDIQCKMEQMLHLFLFCYR